MPTNKLGSKVILSLEGEIVGIAREIGTNAVGYHILLEGTNLDKNNARQIWVSEEEIIHAVEPSEQQKGTGTSVTAQKPSTERPKANRASIPHFFDPAYRTKNNDGITLLCKICGKGELGHL